MKKLLLLPLALLFLTVGCEKDVIDYMEGLYQESQGLQSVTADSVRSFAVKVNNYVTEFPEEKEHPLYPKVQTNIKNACLKLTIVVDTAWDGEKHISF
jgi:hypothetical protein